MKKLNLKTESSLAILALLISVSTLIVYVYQSNIMKEQQRISVWPYIEWMPSWNADNFFIEVNNKGIGPAIVRKVEISLNGKYFKNFNEVVSSIPGLKNKEFSYSTINNRVIAANESIRALSINDPESISLLTEFLKNNDFKFEIYYSSVYGDGWKSLGSKVVEYQFED